MNPFLALQGFLALPYFLLGLALPFVWFDTAAPAQDVETFRMALLVLALVWSVAFAGARRLVQAGHDEVVTDQSNWIVFFPATVRLFAIAAPVASVVGFAAGSWLYYAG
ncbi:MAG: hypothetical protein V4850_35815 [Myxococcota bacterium]